MTTTTRQRVLFLCTGNSARSQMAEGLLRHIAGDQFEVFSAGTRPVGLNPNAVTAMSEIGINIAGNSAKSVDEFAASSSSISSPCATAQRKPARYFPVAGSGSIRVLKTLPLPQRINNCRHSGKYGIRWRIDCRSLCAATIRQSMVLESVARTRRLVLTIS